MLTSVGDLFGQVPFALGVTAGPDHVLELLSPAARRVLGTGADLGRPIREALSELGVPELADVLDRVYRDGVPSAAAGGWYCSPLRDPDGAVTGVLLRGVDAGPPEVGPGSAHPSMVGARARGAALQRLAEELSRAATPAAIGLLTATTAATLLGADAASVYTGPAPGGAVLELVHATGWGADLMAEYRQVGLHRGRPLSDAVLTGEPIWLEDVGQWRARYPEMAPVFSSGGYQATACIPLRVGDRGLGAVLFTFLQPRAFTADERDYLLAVAALCGQALDRARLYVAEQDARATAERQLARMTFLAQANQLMEAPLSVEQRLQRLAEMVVPDVADWCSVHLVRNDRVEEIAVAHADPDKIAFVRRLQERYPADPDAPGGAIQVARTGTPVVFSDIPDELLVAAAVDATHLELIRAIGMRSAIVVPLLLRGTSLGALTLVQAESGQRFTDTDLTFVGQIAARAAVALDNARLYEQQRQVAHTLQTALLPGELPSTPGLALAARYLPQSADLTDIYVGGDLYDVVEGTEPDQWSVMVGDVCGKGPDAAALTALLRHTLRAEVSHGLGPAEALDRVNAAMLRQSGPGRARFATVAHGLVRVDRSGATIRLVNAGHLPPLLLHGEEVVTVRAPGMLLGVYPDLELTEADVRIDHGDSLVLYTDGITEARGVDGFYGSRRLRTALAACAGRPAESIADALLADVKAFQRGPFRDDVAILVVQAAS